VAAVRVTYALGDEDELLAVREGNHRSLPPHARSAGVLPECFSSAGRWARRKAEIEAAKQTSRRIARTTESFARDDSPICPAFFELVKRKQIHQKCYPDRHQMGEGFLRHVRFGPLAARKCYGELITNTSVAHRTDERQRRRKPSPNLVPIWIGILIGFACA